MSKNKKATLITAVAIVTSVFLAGCGLFNGEEKKQIDPPQDVSYLEENEVELEESGKEVEKENTDEAVETTIPVELFLIDKDGYVVPQTLSLPKKEGVAQQALEHLVVNGPIQQMLPNGFRAVLPADTTMTVNIKDGTATVDFSNEFADYNKEDESRILESVTWTLTQFDSVDRVKLQINGNEIDSMPVGGTPIGEELSRADGINLNTQDAVDITNSNALTVYYIGGDPDQYYYVPVTKRIDTNRSNEIASIIQELAAGPGYGTGLLSEFQTDVKLLDEPTIESGKITLNFNESIYSGQEENMISEHTLNTLVLSITEQTEIDSVAITVNGEADLVTEDGKNLTEPVSRPENVNTGSF